MKRPAARWLWAGLGLALVLGLLAPVLSAERTLIYRDALPYTVPLNHLLRGALLEGRLPEWDPSGLAGVPFLANPSSQALYPPRWAAVLLTPSPTQASDLYALLHLLLALFGAAACGRELGLGRAPRRLMAVTYALGGPLLSLLNNLVYFAGAAWLPLSLAWILRARRKQAQGGWPWGRALLLAAAGIAPPFYAGDPQTAGWLALLAACVLLAPRAEGGASAGRRALGLAVLGGATLLLALAQLLPALSLASETTRGAMSYAEIGVWSFHPARLAELLVPFPLGVPFPSAQASVGSALDPLLRAPWSFTCFLGAGTALFAVRGLGPLAAEERRARGALVGLAAVSLLLALGRYTPLHAWVCELTPYKVFRYPEKHLTLFSLALAGLAGFGLQGWLRSCPWREPGRRLLPFAALPLLTLLLIWPLSSWSAALASLELWGAPRTPPAPHGQAYATALVQLWLLWLLARPRLSPARRGGLIVLAVAFTSLGTMSRLVFDGPAGLAESTPPTVEELRRLAPPQPMGPRILRFPVAKSFGDYPAFPGLREAEAAALLQPLTLGDATSALYDLEVLHGMTGFDPRRLARLRGSLSWRAYLERGAVGWILGPWAPGRPTAARLDPRFGIGIYPTEGRPRLELLSDLCWVPSEEQAWASLAEVGTAAVVAVGAGSRALEARSAGEVRASPAMGPRNLGYVRVETRASSAALLVVRDAYFPGWEASLDGVGAPIVLVDGAFMGVEVPAGEHTVELRYRTPGARLGGALSLVSWLALALLLCGASLRSGERSPPER